ncbi:hypothetical protein DVH05_000734 [Phytophthora capsici]|nr:hypothetical protein DVH05_000734 [Phytophthora capsici]
MQSFLVHDDVFIGEPESDMEVELGVNLVDTFTEQHSNRKCHAKVWGPGQSTNELDACALLPAEAYQDEDMYNSDLDDVEQEVLSRALLDDQDVTMKADSKTLIVFLYAFEKFRMVYA